LDEDPGIFLDEPLELFITGDGFLKGGNLISGDVTRDVLPIFPGLVVVVGAIWALPEDAELAPFHVLDLGDLLEEDLRSDFSIHGDIVYSKLYTKSTKKE
jgi:hypothetical protein